MTRDELIEEIKQRRSRLRPCGEGSIATVSDAVFSQCLGLAEQLDSQPAMTWQAEVSGTADVRAYVDGMGDIVATLYREDESEAWQIEWVRTDPGTLASVIVWEPLNGRRVCPIPAPPALPKRGDA